MEKTAIAREIASFIDADGRLTSLPAKKKKRILALVWLADQLPADRDYSEKEFNDVLQTLHTFGDPATLRRELFDFYQINRTLNGRHYCVNPDRPDAEELIAKHCG